MVGQLTLVTKVSGKKFEGPKQDSGNILNECYTWYKPFSSKRWSKCGLNL